MIGGFDKPINWISFIPSLMPMIEVVQGEHRDTIRILTSFCFKYSNAQWKSLGPSTRENQAAVRTSDGREEIRQLETEALLPTMGHAQLG